MILDKNTFIENLKKYLSSSNLPGVEAQLKMSPNVRNPYFESQVPSENSIIAAVLILIISHENSLKTVLIKRPEYNGAHSGQISFPGGKAEKIDKNIFYTALREANEEIGINSENIEIIGSLTTLYVPVSNICIYPVIGFVNESISYNINQEEVAEVIEANIEFLLDETNIDKMSFTTNNFEITAPYYNVQNNKVWGATAMIISELLEVFKKSATPDFDTGTP